MPETTDDTFSFLARKSDSAANWKRDIMLSLPSDDMTFEDTSFICRRTQFQLFNRLFRFDDYAERLEDFRFDVISERQREIAEKKAKRQANRKRHHRRGKKGKLKGNGKLAKETHLSSTVSDDVQEAQAGSPLVGSNSLGLSALKTATQVKGQHKYLNDCLKKSNICVEEHPSVSKPLSYLICEDVHERVHE